MTSSTWPDELGPERPDYARRVEHWCQVVVRLSQRHSQDYLNGDLRTRFAIYHALGLIADSANRLSGDVQAQMSSINWPRLSGMRIYLVHRPWQMDSEIVWAAVTTNVPKLLLEIRRYIARQDD